MGGEGGKEGSEGGGGGGGGTAKGGKEGEEGKEGRGRRGGVSPVASRFLAGRAPHLVNFSHPFLTQARFSTDEAVRPATCNGNVRALVAFSLSVARACLCPRRSRSVC